MLNLFNKTKPQNPKLTPEQQKQAFNAYIWQIQL